MEGSLLGLALGDALGFVVEAAPPETASAYVDDWLLAGRAGERGAPHFPFGQYSDDTQLARALLLGVCDAGGWDPAAFARRVAELFREGRDVGAGPGTRAAAQRLIDGQGWEEAGTPEPYAGNGSAMRVAPLGVLFAADPALLRSAAVSQSRITHQDPRCAGASVAVAGAAALAMRSGPLDRPTFLGELAELVAPASDEVAALVRGLETWAHLAPPAAAAHLRASGLDPGHTDPWQGISAFVLPSLAWSLYAFLAAPDDYWATVGIAIAVGGDTDSMAAMAGGIAGARVGIEGLPQDVLARLNDRGTWGAAELGALARDCARLVPGRT
ncbi:MAG: ADP-ribosylglycohydrolase family protein [Gemmatimonadales bacterium]